MIERNVRATGIDARGIFGGDGIFDSGHIARWTEREIAARQKKPREEGD